MASSEKAEGRGLEEEEEKEKEGEAQKKQMVEEVQRAHHKSTFDESEEGQEGNGKQKKYPKRVTPWETFCFLILGQTWLSVNAAAEGPQRKMEVVRTQELLKESVRERDQTTFKKEPVKKRGGEFRKGRKEGKWKKRRKKKRKNKITDCRKSTRTTWWSKIRKSFVGALMRKRKVVKEERDVEGKAKHPKARIFLGRWGRWLLLLFRCWDKEC